MNKDLDIDALSLAAAENAAGYFKQGANCAESVFLGFYDLGLSDLPKESVALVTGFGGGIGHTKNTCGCVLGGVSAIGLLKGRKDPLALDTPAERSKELNGENGLYKIYAGFVDEFEKQYGSIVCSELTSQYQDFAGKERRKSCLQLVRFAAQSLVKYALE